MTSYRRLVTDQLGRRVELSFPPRRIVSLVPSQTELLYHLGLSDEVVGITKFCIHPDEWFRAKPRIGGTKQLHIDKIRALSPDLIIANKEENEAAQVQQLMDEYPVWVSDIHTLADALEMIRQVGIITDKEVAAEKMVQNIAGGFAGLKPVINKKKTAYLIWKDPWMAAGGDTFINDMMGYGGFENVFSSENRYPVVEPEQLKDCELLLLSSEPYPFREKHVEELQKVLPDTRILLVDGEMFSWYGSRLLLTPAYLISVETL